MPTCVVTGANGFVGSRIVRRLLEHGYAVTALVGSDLDTSNLEGLDVELRDVELLDEPSVRSALRDGEQLIHAAACYRFWNPDPDRIYRVNVGGTQNVLQVAHDLGYRKIVHTSTAGTLTPALHESWGSEDNLFDLRSFPGHYKASKVLAEMAALRMAAEGLPVVIVHPTTVIGEGDGRPTPTGQIILHFINGRMKAYVDTVLNIVDADDVAEGHVLALEAGQIGHRYILGGENFTMAGVLEVLSDLTGIPAPRVAIPHPVLLAAARVNEWIAKHVTHRPPLVEREAALHARSSSHFTSAKAEKELAYQPTQARAALAKAVRWYVAAGRCREDYARLIRARAQVEELAPAAAPAPASSEASQP